MSDRKLTKEDVDEAFSGNDLGITKITTEFSDDPWTFYKWGSRAYYFDSLEEAQSGVEPLYQPYYHRQIRTSPVAMASDSDIAALVKALEGSGYVAAPSTLIDPKKCCCGAAKGEFKVEPYQPGHSTWCDVHESKQWPIL